MSKLISAIALVLITAQSFSQNYNATTGFICQAYTFREGTLLDAPYMFQNVQIQINWVYCGPWSGSNNGNMNFDIFLSDGWDDLFTMTDSGNGCSLVTDYYNIPYSIWNEAIDANNGNVLVRAVISDSCPGGVGCNWYSDPCFEVMVNFDYEPLEAPQANFIVDSETACTGQTISISDLSAGTGLTYSWNFGAGAVPATSNSAGNQNVYYSTTGTKTISLTVTNLLGNHVSTLEIDVNPTPALSVTPDFSACSNTFPLPIAASGIGNFLWSHGLGTEPVVEISPETTTTYTVELSNEYNCSNVAEVEVTVKESPVVNAAIDDAICLGESLQIEGEGNGDIYWQHAPEAGLVINESPSESSDYILYASLPNGCFNADTLTVTVNPVPDANAGEDQEICFGESTVITANGGSTYSWDNNLGEGASHELSPTETSTYGVVVGNEYNCFDEASILITVNPLPDADITEGTSICFGSSTSISASGGIEYVWDQGLGNGAEHVVSPENTTLYTVTVFNEFDCSSSASVEIEVYPDVEISISGLSEDIYCHNDPNAYNLLGSPSGGSFSGFGVNGNQFFPANAGIGPVEITYSFTDEYGCEFTEVRLIAVEVCEGISELEERIEVYPNPVKNELSIALSLSTVKISTLDIVDLNGKIVYSSAPVNSTEILNVNVSNFPSGNYVIRLYSSDDILYKRFVKE